MGEQALTGMRVIDLTQYIEGPVCTKRLADYGADVIKIEPPGTGDGARNMGPFYHDEPHPEKSGLFLYLNTNKRGITLNLENTLGKETFLELVKKADVVVESFKPGTMERLGLSYETLEKVNPRLVMTSISPFGQTGPYREYEMTELMAFGMGGPMYHKGRADKEPLKYGATPTLYHAGAVAAMATVVAYYGMRRHGKGDYIDVSIMDTQLGTMDGRASALIQYQFSGKVASRGAPMGVGPAGTGSGMFPCADGYVHFYGGLRLERQTKMMGDPPELRDPKFYDPETQGDPLVREEYEAYFLSWLMNHTKQEIFELGQASGNVCAPMKTIDEVFEDPQVKVRDLFVDVEHPVTGKVKYPGRPFVMEKSPWAIRRPAPLLGQHNTEVYSELGYSKEDMVALRQSNVI
ncbi:MAG: CoA transferase [Chloroflexi bacterium]|nr:CoA transferase [Chloroflexota bacterium]